MNFLDRLNYVAAASSEAAASSDAAGPSDDEESGISGESKVSGKNALTKMDFEEPKDIFETPFIPRKESQESTKTVIPENRESTLEVVAKVQTCYFKRRA